MLCVCHNQLSDLVNHWTSLQPDYRGLKYIHLNKRHTNIIWNMIKKHISDNICVSLIKVYVL